MTRRCDLGDWLVLALLILVVVGVFASRETIEQVMRAFVTPAAAQGADIRGADIRGADIRGVASVTDGDTLEIHGQRIRLHGIDTPEAGQRCEDANGALYRCGQRASLALSDRIGRKTVTCEPRDMDHRYNRIVAVCYLGDVDLNAWLVQDGAALAYRRYSIDYVGQEDLARRDGRGIWAGRFIAPWDWRKGMRLDSEAPPQRSTAPNGCAIKGSSRRFVSDDKSPGGAFEAMNGRSPSRSGDRIYHMPGQAHDARTRINIGKGERWFCSEAEAQAAGWRRAR